MTDMLASKIRRISEIEQKCREALRYDSVVKKLLSKNEAHKKVCALLDFIGDSENALLSIVAEDDRQHFEPYFLAYGILQIIYSRQVALLGVLKALGLPKPKLLGKSPLVEARDRIIGHPIESDGAAHVIVRHSLNANGFEYSSYYPKETRHGNAVEYEALLKAHLDATEKGMETIYQHIAEFENERRRQMREDPLSPRLKGITYVSRKIGAALFEDSSRQMFSAHAKMLLSALEEFRSGLVNRFGEERTSYEVDHVIEGIRVLQSLFPPKNRRDEHLYQIVSDGIDANIKRLVKIAKDVDEQELADLT